MEDKTLSFTCTTCPMGCQLTVTVKDGSISVSGNGCVRGKAYGESEAVNPVRTLTTTVRASDGVTMLPVRTDIPVPKKLLFDCMAEINVLHPDAGAKIGDIILKNILGTGANVVIS